jgi:hypothetical protein
LFVRHFLNESLVAPNVTTVPVDFGIIQELAPLASSTLPKAEFCIARPPWRSDVRWISPRTVDGYRKFESIFERLGVAPHVAQYLDLDREVRVYAGFLVVRSECAEPDFHVDWEQTNNEAFTLITPLSTNTAGFGLLYRKLNGEIGEYDYKPGEAIILGDHFAHSTKPGRSDEPVVLLSFTFGTDKMEHWEKIQRTAGYQSALVRLPDGEFLSLE